MAAKVTLKDVAKEAGVSYQTVSKVLRGQIAVTPETRARIEEAAARLDYRPNIAARNLRTQSSNLIGYGWQQSGDGSPHPVLNEFLYCAIQRAEAAHFHVQTFLLGADMPETVSLYRDLYARRQVEGFILAETNHDDPRIRFLIDNRIPFSCFGRANDDWDFCWVDVDGQAGLRRITSHLQERGHQQIGLITWPEGSRAGSERETGYLNQMNERGLPICDGWVVRGKNTVNDGYRLMSRLLRLPAELRPTAVSCVSDDLAIGAMHAAITHGLTVGGDIAITGYDNVPMSEFLYPPLTTVRQPIPEAGRLVIELLLKQISGSVIEQRRHLLEPELIVRESS